MDGIRALLPQFLAAIPPTVHLEIAFDASRSIRASIRDVEFTLVLTICVVVLVIFLFLRNFRATLIPGAAVPFSIIGTFAVMYLLGYSLNNLSLMALTLSVGFVVDDAIVMLENIVRHMEMGESRMVAAIHASREIGFTILSMTVSLVAVFIPVLFLGGIVGRLLHEFSVTIVVAILISGFVSLSLTPMLGSRFLKPDHHGEHGFFYNALEGGFNLLARWYERTLRIALRFRLATLAIAFLMLGGTVYLFRTMPTGFIPSQDGGNLMFAAMQGPQDTSFESMAAHAKAVGDVIRAHPAIAARRHLRARRWGRRESGNRLRRHLKPREERSLSVDQIIDQLRPKDRRRSRHHHVPSESAAHHHQRRKFRSQRLSAHPAKREPAGDLHLGAPARTAHAPPSRRRGCAERHADCEPAGDGRYRSRPRAFSRDHAAAGAGHAVQRLQQPRSVGHLRARQPVLRHSRGRARIPAIPGIAFQNVPAFDQGVLVPIESLVRTTRQIGPLQINHYGQLPAVTLGFNLRPGYSLGQTADAMNATIRELRMPASITANFQGTVKEFQNSFRNLTLLLAVALVVIYIVLGILYESFIHPITILSGLPSAVFGALLTLVIFHKELDLYAFVGIIMLFGVVKKNAIMMIDFAIDARHQGQTAYDAIWNGCLLRFRPIMMTTVAALFGTLPIALGYGEGADARQPLGLAVVVRSLVVLSARSEPAEKRSTILIGSPERGEASPAVNLPLRMAPLPYLTRRWRGRFSAPDFDPKLALMAVGILSDSAAPSPCRWPAERCSRHFRRRHRRWLGTHTRRRGNYPSPIVPAALPLSVRLGAARRGGTARPGGFRSRPVQHPGRKADPSRPRGSSRGRPGPGCCERQSRLGMIDPDLDRSRAVTCRPCDPSPLSTFPARSRAK